MNADFSAPDSEVLALRREAQMLLECAGLLTDCTLERIRGGGNNRVFRVTLPGQPRPVGLLKVYFHSASDPRDRFEHEHAFYSLLKQAGVRQVPESLAWDARARLGLFEWVEGTKLHPEEVEAEHVQACARFFVDLNAARCLEAAGRVPEASESCFRLADHIGMIDRRVQRLRALQSDAQAPAELHDFVRAKLVPVWAEIRRNLTAQSNPDQALRQSLRCVSPSDFGFHNMLRSARGLLFFDFEYAGWDDPAKMVCDFFCQPEIPVPREMLPAFIEATCLPGWDSKAYARRVFALLPAYRIKWVCIILNVFMKDASRRRAFADEHLLSEDALQRQLGKAQAQLDALIPA